jgi:hypothetical protein
MLAVMKRLAILTVLTLAVLCTYKVVFAGESAASPKPADTKRQHEADDIREAVFRYQIATNDVSKAKVYFLSIGIGAKGRDIFDASHDPSADFMKRFDDLKAPIRKASASTFGSPDGWVVEKRSGKRGVLFQIRSVKWISETEVEVEGGFAAGMLYARGYTYTVKKEKGKWSVKTSNSTWMS